MNKQTWEKLSLEEQIKWWDSNSLSDATHYSTGMFYKYIEGSWRYWNEHSWVVSSNPVEWFTNLIAKPIKLYIPKAGERCELIFSDGEWREISVIFVGSKAVVFELDGVERVEYKNNELFRPLRTERDTRAVDLYRMFHKDGLQDREIMQTDKFNTYLSMWDTLVKIQRGDV